LGWVVECALQESWIGGPAGDTEFFAGGNAAKEEGGFGKEGVSVCGVAEKLADLESKLEF
jgi:hypothetical protein